MEINGELYKPLRLAKEDYCFDFVFFFLFLLDADFTTKMFKKEVLYQRFAYNILNRYQSEWSKGQKVEVDLSKDVKDSSQLPVTPKLDKNTNYNSWIWKYNPNDDDLSDNRWKLELDWLTKALEPALQLCRRALPTGMFISIASSQLYLFHALWCCQK